MLIQDINQRFSDEALTDTEQYKGYQGWPRNYKKSESGAVTVTVDWISCKSKKWGSTQATT